MTFFWREPAGSQTTRRPPDHRTWYWHVSRSSGLGKTILQGTVKGGKDDKADLRRGGMTTPGNGKAWGFDKPQRAVENQEKMKKLLIKSSVVPERSSRLIRERWGERERDYDFALSWALHIKNQSQSIWLSYFFHSCWLMPQIAKRSPVPWTVQSQKSIVLVHQCNWWRRHADKNHQTVKENFHHEYNY